MSTVKLNLDGLTALRAQMEELSKAKVQVGLFSDTAGRVAPKNKLQDNPSVGFMHEFGMMFSIAKTRARIYLPERSFIRVPLMTRLGDEVQKFEGWGASFEPKKMLGKLGLLAENIIQKAFDTGGFGVWPKLSPRTIARKKSSAILIDTAQLRKAISSRVVV